MRKREKSRRWEFYGPGNWEVPNEPKLDSKEVKRYDQYFRIIRKLNNENRQGTRALFDCGDLGFALIYWHKNWEVEWFNEIERIENEVTTQDKTS